MKIKIILFCVLLLPTLFFIISCKEIIEPSIEKRPVILKAPGDAYQSTTYKLTFWWDEVEDALNYRFQVVSGTFDAPGSLIIDTLIQTNQFTLSVDPGDYQWRVMAVNGSSQTAFSVPRAFTVLQSSIKKQAAALSAPADHFVTNRSAVLFRWESLYGATKYRLQVDVDNFADETKVLLDKTIPGQQLSYTFRKDQTYQWRVMAENDTAKARWSAVYQVRYDHIPPARVILTAPARDTLIASPVTLRWSAVTDAIRYKVYLLKSDSTTTFEPQFPVTVNTNTYSLAVSRSGEKIYWKVSAVDDANNEGQASVLRNFTLR